MNIAHPCGGFLLNIRSKTEHDLKSTTIHLECVAKLMSSVSFSYLLLGVGIDGGNVKERESNNKSIQLIKQRGKVKALDEEIHSKWRLRFSLVKPSISHFLCWFDL